MSEGGFPYYTRAMAKSKGGKNLATLTRKELRKQKRSAKSARKAAHFSRKRLHRGEDTRSLATTVDEGTAVQARKLERDDRGKRSLVRSSGEERRQKVQKEVIVL